jgi:replicative DNA helicase
MEVIVMVLDAQLVLDALCLAIYSDSAETRLVVSNVLDLYNESITKGALFNDDTVRLYASMLKEIVQQNLDTHSDAELAALLLKFESHKIIKDAPDILTNIKRVVADRKSVSVSRIASMRNRIYKTTMVVRGNDVIRKLFNTSTKLITSADANKQDSLFVELIEKSRELVRVYEGSASMGTSTIDHIDMSCAESVRKGLESFKHKRQDTGYVLGLQQLAEMFGENRGPVPGECIGIAALSYHYKSGMMMDFVRYMAQYNMPRKRTDKPAAIVFISLENEIYENMMVWFHSAYYNAFKRPATGLSDDELVQIIVELYQKNGFHLLVYREEGDEFGWTEWKNLHDTLSEKYEILTTVTDYIGLMALEEGEDNNAKKYQKLISSIKNYCARHNIINVTGLQLDTQAEALAKSGKRNVVSQLGAVHLADCKGIKRELDVLIFLFIEVNHLGTSYLTAWLDKHKYNKMPPASKRYMAVPFTEYGIVDDIHGVSSHVPDIYNITSPDTTTGSVTTLF